MGSSITKKEHMYESEEVMDSEKKQLTVYEFLELSAEEVKTKSTALNFNKIIKKNEKKSKHATTLGSINRGKGALTNLGIRERPIT